MYAFLSRRFTTLIAATLVIAAGLAWCYPYLQYLLAEPYQPPAPSFAGASDGFKQSIILPTLDTPIPEGKSAVWCVSFQLAWNHLKDDVVNEPIRIQNAQTEADRLNNARQTEQDIDPKSVFATAGLSKDGILPFIQSEMARRFPNVAPPNFTEPDVGAVAYAYLEASAKYDLPYFENDEPFVFTDADSKHTAVGSFGIRKRDDYAYHRMREQVRVLYATDEAIWKERDVPEFILDLCQTSQPNQVVVARVDRKASLAETLAYIEQKTAAAPASDSYKSTLGPRDTLLVPNMCWEIYHRFRELEGKDKPFLNSLLRDWHISTASQSIKFRLDRSGSEVASESKFFVKPGATYFHVNRPFLVYMKKRDAKHPFFVAWIENAELLTEFQSAEQELSKTKVGP